MTDMTCICVDSYHFVPVFPSICWSQSSGCGKVKSSECFAPRHPCCCRPRGFVTLIFYELARTLITRVLGVMVTEIYR